MDVRDKKPERIQAETNTKANTREAVSKEVTGRDPTGTRALGAGAFYRVQKARLGGGEYAVQGFS